MTTEQIIETLKYMPCVTSRKGELAIDAAIEQLQALEKERDEARREAVAFRDACCGDSFVNWAVLNWEEGSSSSERPKTSWASVLAAAMSWEEGSE